MSEPKVQRWECETDEFGDSDMQKNNIGNYVRYEDYARLKAEVERLTSDLQMEKENEDRLVREWQRANNEVYGLQTQVAALIDNQTRLKAEVERLKASPFADKKLAVAYGSPEHLAEENARLQAEVERLTKAGDSLHAFLINYIVEGRISSSYLNELDDNWNAAKEGKQS